MKKVTVFPSHLLTSSRSIAGIDIKIYLFKIKPLKIKITSRQENKNNFIAARHALKREFLYGVSIRILKFCNLFAFLSVFI